MTEFLDRIDSAPIFEEKMPDDFVFWLTIFVDSINQTIDKIENIFNGDSNGLIAPHKTTAEILALAPTAVNGTIWYCSDVLPPNLVFKLNGSLYKPVLALFP